jgi:hypothetical protein
MDVRLPISRLRRHLLVAWAVVAGLGLFAELAVRLFDVRALEPWLPFVSLSWEQNLPTWWSSALLFACAALLALVARGARGSAAARWGFLAAALLYVSLDESASIHEHANDWFDLGGFLYFGWVIPAGAAVVLLGLAYLPFLLRLPHATRDGFVLAAMLFVGGALGVELLLGRWTDVHGDQNLGYALIDFVEEALEMLGSTVFLVTLAAHLGGSSGTLRIALGETGSAPPERERDPAPVLSLDERRRRSA